MSDYKQTETIVALATPPGTSAIAVIRVSGTETFKICNKIFRGKNLEEQNSHSIHYGAIRDEDMVIDEVLISLFKGPKSFTKEDVIEISCHGSEFIVKRIIQLLLKNGARLAKAGEFTKRAFLNGQFDLAQAEAIADLIASDSEAAHKAAINQMRGGFSKQIKQLRDQLIYFASMIELELDFGEEDVEFAKRDELKNLVYTIERLLIELINSFDLGNAIKNGVPTVIAGKPNAGKSTLLNVLFNEEKAIVSDIPGTTRDVIEDELIMDGIRFRLTDTAGLRETIDTIEALGVAKTKQKLQQASLIMYIFDISKTTPDELRDELSPIQSLNIPLLIIANKIDQVKNETDLKQWQQTADIIPISAAKEINIALLKEKMLSAIKTDQFKTGSTLVTNIRHYENLRQTKEALDQVTVAIDSGLSGDLLALDIRSALHYLGEITGEITTDDLLATIFSKFCIGK